MRMNKKKELVPKLRFPEYIRNKLKITKLGKISSIVKEKAGENEYTLMSVTSGVGLIPQAEKFGREIAGDSYKNYIVIKKYDFAYNKSATKQFPEGYISMLGEYDIAAVPNSIFTCFRITDNESYPPFFDYLWHNNYHGHWLRKYIEVGARAHGALSVDTKHLWSMPLALPDFKEQQKIADCLSSIDELIDAESIKLKALEKYKKGLMQKLFPAEGKTLPEWRFPEFRGKNEWRIKPLGKICTNYDSRRIPITEKDRVRGEIPYIGASGVIDYINDFIFDEDLLCVSEDGANLVARTYPIAFSISGKTWVNNHAHVLKFSHKYTQNIVESYLNMINLQDFLTGMVQPKLNRAKLDIIPIPLSEEEEQQKISDFLSEADTIIKEQSNKVEQLKAHKKGLMQGLFPSLEEADV